jgi:ABC-type polysaccharide/polyol phosphate export permease
VRSLDRIFAVADKEWRLNLRFPVEYLANNAVTPLKSAVLMFFLYRGFLIGNNSLGVVQKGNFAVFVLVGTTCHSLFMNSLSVFRTKMVMEKYWQTITGTLISPASIMEVILGFIVGSVGLHLFISVGILFLVAMIYGISFSVVFMSLGYLFIIAFLGFGLGLIGTTLSLVWEGKCFIFDYALQLLVFFSCFYYPIETLPKALHPLIRWLPTYRASEAMQHLFLFGHAPHFTTVLAFLLVSTTILLCGPAFFLDYSIKKYGTVGY